MSLVPVGSSGGEAPRTAPAAGGVLSPPLLPTKSLDRSWLTFSFALASRYICGGKECCCKGLVRTEAEERPKRGCVEHFFVRIIPNHASLKR